MTLTPRQINHYLQLLDELVLSARGVEHIGPVDATRRRLTSFVMSLLDTDVRLVLQADHRRAHDPETGTYETIGDDWEHDWQREVDRLHAHVARLQHAVRVYAEHASVEVMSRAEVVLERGDLVPQSAPAPPHPRNAASQQPQEGATRGDQ